MKATKEWCKRCGNPSSHEKHNFSAQNCRSELRAPKAQSKILAPMNLDSPIIDFLADAKKKALATGIEPPSASVTYNQSITGPEVGADTGGSDAKRLNASCESSAFKPSAEDVSPSAKLVDAPGVADGGRAGSYIFSNNLARVLRGAKSVVRQLFLHFYYKTQMKLTVFSSLTRSPK